MELEDVINRLKLLKSRRVFVQFPEGIRLRIKEIVKVIEKEGIDVVLCTEPCFGACDIRDNEAMALGCDSILHIGHEDFGVKSTLPVVFWEYFIKIDPLPILQKELKKMQNFKKIGLVTSIQFVHTIPKIKHFLEMVGKKVFVHRELQYPGQVLGCRLEAAKKIEDKVDCFLCITAGKFYGLGIILETDKPVLCFDLERKEIYSLDDLKKKLQKIIAWNKSQIEDARVVGLLISWKKGQFNPNVFKIKKKFETEGKDVYVLAMDEITPEKLEGLELEGLVNFACPRIGIDDVERYKIPIVNWDQI